MREFSSLVVQDQRSGPMFDKAIVAQQTHLM
jgi:hypothetical protein